MRLNYPDVTYLFREDGVKITYWECPVPKPSIEELEGVDSTELEVLEELHRLDNIIPRHIEEVLEGKTLYGEIKTTVERKKELRSKLSG